MIIVTYESRDPDTPPHRRWLAQVEKISRRLYVTFQGATEDEARGKAQAFWDDVIMKGKSLIEGVSDDEDLLV